MLFLINLKIKCVTVAAQRMDGEVKVLYLQYSYNTYETGMISLEDCWNTHIVDCKANTKKPPKGTANKTIKEIK